MFGTGRYLSLFRIIIIITIIIIIGKLKKMCRSTINTFILKPLI